MKLFYNLNLKHNDKELTLFDSEHSHLTKVLRKKIDEIVYLTNGRGYLFEAMIVQINLKDTKLKILSSLKKPKMNYYLNVAISPTKKNDRFEWFVEKAIEIGVSSITPIITTYTERRTLNYSRLNKIAVSAMKQSLQTYLPVINPITDFKEYLKTNQNSNNYIAHCNQSDKSHLSKSIERKSDSNIIIGPEGGFKDDEIKLAMDFNYTPISLGVNRLRTETAGIVSCQIFSDFNN